MTRSKWLLYLLIPVLAIPLARFCHLQTDGFKMSKIRGNCLTTQMEDNPLPSPLCPALNQPFTYLGRGKQAFVFASKDGQLVLKLFNNRYHRFILWHSLIPGSQKATYYQEKLKKVGASYHLCQTTLQPFTGLLYLHTAPTCTLNQKVTLIDRLGIAHTIDLDTAGFALQVKGTPAYAHIDTLMNQGHPEKALEALKNLVHLIKTRQGLQIVDNDPLIRTNLGFYQGLPFYMDLGPFSQARGEENREDRQRELDKITQSLLHFVESNHPILLPTLKSIINNEKQSF